ncbi:hypothetical protein [Limnohabitans sp. Rim28]|uniref:hypothetical protein n=1 Tax=Limnohabitans sp. Rim28 TaxID=1100720 RepID=UPI0002D8813D|nr:hypothetical protein [Limnohabitans sp. Rim28]PVE09456.1 hypothetical protein B472_01110 [Limnohabitans sp. Rim28]
MKRFSFSIAFGLGALALLWVAAAVASSHFLVLVMTALIGAVYAFGALELRQYRATTQTMNQALAQLPPDLVHLNDWLITLPADVQNPVRQRVEGERVGLPGPVFTPYLIGLLVMLGMLGTFLGMVVTLNGAVFALEGSSSIAGVRAAFSEPIKGLGLAFGTSVAGVATSAMLGLMSSLARQERALASQQLDSLIPTHLHRFSLTHQRQATYKALQQQAQALPQVVEQLQNMMVQMASTSEQLHARLLSNQQGFHQEAHSAYSGLAQSVDQSLQRSLSQSLQLATDSMKPMVQASMAQLAQQAQTLNDRLQQIAQVQLSEINTQLTGTAKAMVDHIGTAQAEQNAKLNSADQERLQVWQAALAQMASSLSTQWQASGAQTLAQQQALCDTLARTAQELTTHTQTQATQTLAEITRLMGSSEALVRQRIDSEATWTAQHAARAQELSVVLRQELGALRDQEAQRGDAAVARLADLQTALTHHLGTLGTALEDPINRLIETASQAPKAAAEVIGQLRQEISVSVARDNALLEERTRILATLSTLLDAINHASTEQRGVIEALVTSSQATLDEASGKFQDHVTAETDKLGGIAAQVTASAVDVASLGETFGFAVRAFSETNDKLMAHLQRIEAAMNKSMTRSDEQLAYYVAQAREIVDLSIGSQKDVLEALQRRTDLATQGAV